ncbi:MAG: phenylalanine--tRNA ligase subunit alpha [Verrucomicrobiota bacterium]
MIKELNELKEIALSELETADSAEKVEAWRITFFSRQGKLPKLLEGMKSVAAEDRPAVGKTANRVKTALQEAFDERKAAFELAGPGLPEDLTLPGMTVPEAPIHIIQQTLDRMIEIFQRMGFSLAEGPEIETEWKNFDALNTPPEHPARNEQDTFYLDLNDDPKEGRWLLRTHTSPVQIRTMLSSKPPLKIIAPGRCYRRDEVDATHGMFFHQIEGLVVDKGIHLGHLKGTLEHFFREFVGPEIVVRFRPHFFPFTEPSFEADMGREGLKIRGKDWVEVAGCGMVDPAVFDAVQIDPEAYTGFAFGIGVERMAMMRHEIPDLRLFYDNDIRFLKQFY